MEREATFDEVSIRVVHDEIIEETNLTLKYDGEDNKDAKLRALPKNSPTYELEKFEKKVLIIFNHKHFKDEAHETRLGTEQDVIALRKTFTKFGFDVVEHLDFKQEEVFKTLETFTKTDFTDYGCVAIAILTHGKEDHLKAYDQKFYSENDIIQYLSDKPTLVTKPRILIIQACRGMDPLGEVEVKPRIKADGDSDEEPYYLTMDSDFLILHSSFRGKRSFRNEVEGSWFIQTLCKKLDELAFIHDLESIVIDVKREVVVDKKCEKFNRNTMKYEIYKQIPVVTSTLIRKLYLKKYGDAAPPNLHDLLTASISSADRVLDSSVQNAPLPSQSPKDFDHSSYTWNCLRLMDWMSTTETNLQSAKYSEEYFLRLNREVEEYRSVLDKINLIGSQQIPTGEGTIPIKDILTRHNKRFEAIIEGVQAITIKNTQDNVGKTDDMIETKTSCIVDKIIEKNLQEFEKKKPTIYNAEEVVQHLAEMKELLSRLQDSYESMNKLNSYDRQTMEKELAKLDVIMRSFSTYESRLDMLNVAAKQISIVMQGTKKGSEIAETFAALNYRFGKLQEQVKKRQKEISEALKKCFHGEVEELLSWVSEVEGLIISENPVGVGGLENASSSEALHRFMAIYAEMEAKREIEEEKRN